MSSQSPNEKISRTNFLVDGCESEPYESVLSCSKEKLIKTSAVKNHLAPDSKVNSAYPLDNKILVTFRRENLEQIADKLAKGQDIFEENAETLEGLVNNANNSPGRKDRLKNWCIDGSPTDHENQMTKNSKKAALMVAHCCVMATCSIFFVTKP